MPIQVSDIGDAKTSYKEGAGVAGARYRRKVKKANWHDPASGDPAQKLYDDKMSDPVVRARRQKRIAQIPNTEWQKQADEQGGAVIGARMTAAVDKWGTRTQPFLEALRSVDMPDKTSDPLQNLTARGGAVVSAMVKKKQELLGE